MFLYIKKKKKKIQQNEQKINTKRNKKLRQALNAQLLI